MKLGEITSNHCSQKQYLSKFNQLTLLIKMELTTEGGVAFA